MRRTLAFTLLAPIAFAGMIAGAACGDEEGLVRPRLSDPAAGDGGTADGGALACGAAVPTEYVSPSFTTNASVELALGAKVSEIAAKIIATEQAGTGVVTAEELKGLYSSGQPSLQAVSTASAQAALGEYFDALGEAFGKTWSPEDAAADGGAASGGKYAGTFYFTKTGVDLRRTPLRVLLGGAFYNHVLGLIAAPITDVSLDRILAAYGAKPRFADNGDPTSGPDADTLVAALAEQRDKSGSITGPYRRIRQSFLRMKGAVAGGATCKADLDAAVAELLAEWERVTYASAITALERARVSAVQSTEGPVALHYFGEAVGLVQSFSGLAADKRKIKDDQIASVLDKMGAATAFVLVTNAGTRGLLLEDAINLIAAIEGFTAEEVASFKQF